MSGPYIDIGKRFIYMKMLYYVNLNFKTHHFSLNLLKHDHDEHVNRVPVSGHFVLQRRHRL